MVLFILSLVALVVAAVLAVIAWLVIREDRLRSEARVAALASAALDDTASDVVVTTASPESGTTLFERRASMRGHPLVRVAAGFAMSVAVIVLIAMSGSRHTVRDEPQTTAAATKADSPLELLSMRPERSADALTVTGLVRNGGHSSAKGLTAVVFAFDRSGNFLASGRAPLDFVTLAPGDESPFRVTVMQAGDVGRYRITFRNDAGVVRHIDRRGSLQAKAQ
jgi:hypothetical protein